jgi:hypothetical protein
MCDEVRNITVRHFSGTVLYGHEIKRNYEMEIKNHCIKFIVICDKVMKYDYVLYDYNSCLHWPPVYFTLFLQSVVVLEMLYLQ